MGPHQHHYWCGEKISLCDPLPRASRRRNLKCLRPRVCLRAHRTSHTLRASQCCCRYRFLFFSQWAQNIMMSAVCYQSKKRDAARFLRVKQHFFTPETKKAQLMELFRDFCYCCYRWKWECIYVPAAASIYLDAAFIWMSERARPIIFSQPEMIAAQSLFWCAWKSRTTHAGNYVLRLLWRRFKQNARTERRWKSVWWWWLSSCTQLSFFCAKLFLRRIYRYYNLPFTIRGQFKNLGHFLRTSMQYAFLNFLKPRP